MKKPEIPKGLFGNFVDRIASHARSLRQGLVAPETVVAIPHNDGFNKFNQ